MQFLSQHWHCIFPLAGVIVGLVLFRDTKGEKGKVSDKNKLNNTGGTENGSGT